MKEILTLSTFNDRLKRFGFGYTETSDIPSLLDEKVLKTDKKIRQSASKMTLLAMYLPLLIGDLKPEDCEHFKLFLTCLRYYPLQCPGRYLLEKSVISKI